MTYPSHAKLISKTLVSTIILALTTLHSFSVEKDLVIKGTVQLPSGNASRANACSFQYHDLLSGKKVIIPVLFNERGMFELSIPLDGYQQLSLIQAYIKNGDVDYSTGLTLFKLFGKPGQIIQFSLNSPIGKGLSVKFAGDFATENQQYEQYNNSLGDQGGSNPYRLAQSVTGDYEAIKLSFLKNAAIRRTYNISYFNKNGTSQFVKQQTAYDLLYETADAINQLVIAGKISDAMHVDLFQALGVQVKNTAAWGNGAYINFIQSHYLNLLNKVDRSKLPAFPDADLATFALQKATNLAPRDLAVLRKMAAAEPNITAVERVHFGQLVTSSRMLDNYLGSNYTSPDLDYFCRMQDPYLRDLYATKTLFKMMDGELDYIKPNLDIYKQQIADTYLKTKFLKAYDKHLAMLSLLRVSAKSIIHDSKNLKGPGLFKTLVEQFKGKVLYIDIWATWCAPCLAEMPNAKKLRSQLAGKDVVFVYLCISSPSDKVWKERIAAHAIEGENYFLDIVQSNVIKNDFKISGIPRYVLVDRAGTIVSADASSPGDAATLAAIKSLL